MIDELLPEMIVQGEGTVAPPPLTDADLVAMRARADACADAQLRTDIYRLLAEVERARKPQHFLPS